ncbi:MAG: hypothetical protein MJ137_05845 [Clostridia bacterium]|nr:hypothetical protein [Clostridia bacterium]
MGNNNQIFKGLNLRLTLRSFFAGEKCAACGETDTKGLSVLCPGCIEKLNEKKRENCPRCRKTASECRCVRKNMTEAGIDSFFKLGFYRSDDTQCPLNTIIYRLKRNKDGLLAEVIADELSPAVDGYLKKCGIQNAVLTYVPRSRKKVLAEGTDQAKLLAVKIADRLGLTCWGLLERRSDGRSSQKRLGVAARDESVSGLFAPVSSELIKGRTVLLVDDLITTGATVSECARTLKRAGAAGVICISIAEA